jgi:hypothetical protein
MQESVRKRPFSTARRTSDKGTMLIACPNTRPSEEFPVNLQATGFLPTNGEKPHSISTLLEFLVLDVLSLIFIVRLVARNHEITQLDYKSE